MRSKTLRGIRRLDPGQNHQRMSICWGPLETPAARTARVARALRHPPRCKGMNRPICRIER